MQHIVVRTARTENLKAKDWRVNGVGKLVSHSFGYGLIDAYAMVQLAKVWKRVPKQHHCEILAPQKNKYVSFPINTVCELTIIIIIIIS